MKASIESTWREELAGGVMTRVFEGTTDTGIPFIAYVVQVQIFPDDPRQMQLDAELARSRHPSPEALRAIATHSRRKR